MNNFWIISGNFCLKIRGIRGIRGFADCLLEVLVGLRVLHLLVQFGIEPVAVGLGGLDVGGQAVDV